MLVRIHRFSGASNSALYAARFGIKRIKRRLGCWYLYRPTICRHDAEKIFQQFGDISSFSDLLKRCCFVCTRKCGRQDEARQILALRNRFGKGSKFAVNIRQYALFLCQIEQGFRISPCRFAGRGLDLCQGCYPSFLGRLAASCMNRV